MKPGTADPRLAALRVLQERRRSAEAKSVTAAGLLLLSTSMAAKFLRRTERTSAAFPDAYLAGDALAIDLESKNALSAYADELSHLEESASVSSLPFAKVTAPGFGILASSVQAVADASITFLNEGRALWQALLRGEPTFALHYRDVLDANASDEDIAYDLYVPLMLVPDWAARSSTSRHRTLPSDSETVAGASKNNEERDQPASFVGAQPAPEHGAGPALQPGNNKSPNATDQGEDKILESIRAALTSAE